MEQGCGFVVSALGVSNLVRDPGDEPTYLSGTTIPIQQVLRQAPLLLRAPYSSP